MKVHHLNCGCMCPAGAKLFPSVFPSKVICHCLLIESKEGLVLVDTGFSREVLDDPKKMGLLSPLLGLQPAPEDAAVEQVKRLGFKVEDVRHLIPTHLDNDHAGAIFDFPTAKIHTSTRELQTAKNPSSFVERIRFREFHEGDPSRWIAHELPGGEDWFGFKGVRPLAGTDDEILLIPLFGHTPGHCGVAVRSEGRWLFHVGDSYYHHNELKFEPTLGYKFFLRTIHGDYPAAMANQRRLRELKSSTEIEIFCAHDPSEL